MWERTCKKESHEGKEKWCCPCRSTAVDSFIDWKVSFQMWSTQFSFFTRVRMRKGTFTKHWSHASSFAALVVSSTNFLGSYQSAKEQVQKQGSPGYPTWGAGCTVRDSRVPQGSPAWGVGCSYRQQGALRGVLREAVECSYRGRGFLRAILS